MNRFVHFALIAALGFGVTGCGTQAVMTQDAIFEKYPTVQLLQKKLLAGRSNDVALLSPGQFSEAQKHYDEALKWAKADHAKGNQFAQLGLNRFEAASAQAMKARDTFEDLLAARRRAILAGADVNADSAFKEAEEDLLSLSKLLEAGKDEKAKSGRNDLKRRYDDIELANLKRDTVDRAKRALASAQKDDIDDFAPRTLKRAQEELDLALSTLDVDRNNRGKAETHAMRSLWHTQQAIQIAEIIKHYDASDFDEEEQVLWYQDQLSAVLQPLGTTPEFNEANKIMIKKSQSRIATLVQDNIALKSELEQAQTAAIQMEKQKEAEIAATRMMSEEAKRRQAENDARFAYVQSLFSDNEAEVYRQGDNVIIRAQGFYFPSGQSEIQSSNFALLNKIVSSIARFPEANIIVSGHTDNRGDDLQNQRLSEDRAVKVVRFLTDVGQINAQRLSAVGYGKQRPVASNDSEVGRTLNRRVEFLIVNQKTR
ncbi:MAG: OmpA family protein [Hahellaceae bacterium]|nr:OmpA family protein [Hahellaceae bacterium]MCP5169782.1 OmpA family protein [Hahellaceae bacterium]